MTVTMNQTARPVQQPLAVKPKVDSQQLSSDAMALEIARLKAENAALAAKVQAKPKAAAITAKVSDGGALSIYGLGRFPVTLYVEGFDRLDAAWGEVRAFVEAHRGEFKHKDEDLVAYCARTGKDAAAIMAKRAEAAAKRNS